jgi:hypothetical protein
MSRTLELGEQLVLLREAALALLREDEPAVGEHVELVPLPGDDRGADAVLRQDGRETRSPSVVAPSDGAVVDLDGHARTVAGPAAGA